MSDMTVVNFRSCVSRKISRADSHGMWHSVRRSVLESLYIDANKWYCRAGSTLGERRKHLQYVCNRFWIKVGVVVPCGVTVICETFKASYRTGKDHRANNSSWIDDWISPDVCQRAADTSPVQ